jgi:type I restriction-modification system DNA methylase subunit
MKKTEFGGKLTKIPSPYDATSWKTERSAVAVLMHWMREIIEQKQIDLGLPDVDTSGTDRKSPDIIICESRRSQDVLCVIEAKHPYFDVFDYENLRKPAWEKANARKAKYFATTNFKELIWFNTQKVNEQRNEEEQVVHKYPLSEIENLDLIEETRYKGAIIKQLEIFLARLYTVHSGREAEPKLPTDEFLIYRLHSKIERLSKYYTEIIYNRCHKDSAFAKELSKWFVSQGWSFAWQPQDFDKAARQTAYLLVNKILFYNVLQAKRPSELPLLKIPEGLFKGAQLQKILQSFFDEVLKIDYDTIYTADFIDTVAFPDDKEVIKEIEDLVKVLRQYDFSKLRDIIGPIFERLIPTDERHNLGQYFTNPDVVDIILRFCLRHEDDKVLDPACGAGTFLVRAYQHKKLMSQFLKHEDILDTLWGNDIAKFPAHLSTINLAIRDLSVDKNYPNILQEDFFNLLSTEGGFELSMKSRKAIAKRLDMREKEVTYPRWFDCVVGNPPYTRQEEMPEIAPEVKEYKEKIIKKALEDNTGKRIAEISKRAGIHAYFFVHGTKFLQNGGGFGFIVSNSWLDVDYGKGLQEFFLNNYKIIAIIESKVERWFEEADVNTCIVILEKSKDKKERNENLVRFVYLFKPLTYFIPPAEEMWQKQIERLNEIDKLKKTIMSHSEFYQNEELRILPKSQAELWEEGFDKESGKYVGAKWGKYIRAPEIFFKILEKGKDKLVPLKQIAEVRFGIKTGARRFFYLTEKQIETLGLEKEFWTHKGKGQVIQNHIVTSIRDSKCIEIQPDKLKWRMVAINKDKIHLKGTNAIKYIQWGERQGFHRRPTCSSRDKWYSLGEVIKAPILSPYAAGDRMVVLFNGAGVFANDNLVHIIPHQENAQIVCALLNSTIFLLMSYVSGVELTGSVNVIKLNPIYTGRIFTVNPEVITHSSKTKVLRAFERMKTTPIKNILSEISLTTSDRVITTKSRKELDKVVMGEILGLSDEEQLEVYRAVVDLVKSRIEKAKSFGKRRKTKEGIDIDLLVKTVMDKLGEDTLGKFYREKILFHKPLRSRSLPRVSGEVKLEHELFGWRLSSGREHLDCTSETEARYLKVWLEAAQESIKIPKDEDYLKDIVPELESLKQKTDEVFEDYLGSILDPRLCQRLLHQLWQEAMK